MKPDIVDQVRDYLDAITSSITMREVESTPLTDGGRPIARPSRAWLAFAGAFAGVLIIGVVTGLLLAPTLSGPTTPSQSAPPTVPETDTECRDAPSSELEGAVQDFPIGISSESVSPGDRVDLFIGTLEGAAPESLVVGLTTRWQCWNGAQWVDTLLLAKGLEGTGLEPLVQAVDSDVIATGFYVPLRAVILIPDVPPGHYRIGERIHQDEATNFDSYLIIEVR